MNAKLYLKNKKESSVLRQHPWIFSGAISRSEGTPEEGDIVDVYSSEGKFIARGHCQIGSIAVRILTFSDESIDHKWWMDRLSSAYRLRKTLGLTDNGTTDCYRLVHGEGDLLPGLIIDIYGNTAIIQCHSVGMYVSRDIICSALLDIYGGKIVSVYDKSSQTVPYKAELGAEDHYMLRSGDTTNIVRENGVMFNVNWEKGQKTGFFLDQRDNRSLLARYSEGRSVLNTFCYTGGFSVYALAAGAARVVSVDSSAYAMEAAVSNVELNFGTSVQHEALTADAISYLKNPKEKFDTIIVDPPAFAKHHNALPNALKGYRKINTGAISMLSPGGILFTFSCSQAVSREQFRLAVFSAAATTGRKVRILHHLSQPADHPVNIYHPEGEYLKGLVLQVE